MTTHDADAARLIELYQDLRTINKRNAERCGLAWDDPERLTGAHIDAAFAVSDRLDEACEVFRRRHYPRAGRVICALGMVSTLSPKGRRGRIVFEAERVDA